MGAVHRRCRYERHRLIVDINITHSHPIWLLSWGWPPATRQTVAKETRASEEELRQRISTSLSAPFSHHVPMRSLGHFSSGFVPLFNMTRARCAAHTRHRNKKSVKDLERESCEVCTMGVSILRGKYSHFRWKFLCSLYRSEPYDSE